MYNDIYNHMYRYLQRYVDNGYTMVYNTRWYKSNVYAYSKDWYVYGYVYITYVIYILQTERERDGHNIYLRADSSLGQAAVSEVAASAANLQRPRSFRSDDQTFGWGEVGVILSDDFLWWWCFCEMMITFVWWWWWWWRWWWWWWWWSWWWMMMDDFLTYLKSESRGVIQHQWGRFSADLKLVASTHRSPNSPTLSLHTAVPLSAQFAKTFVSGIGLFFFFGVERGIWDLLSLDPLEGLTPEFDPKNA